MSRQSLTTLFTSLARDTHRWTLLRTLKSDNPMDIQGELRGTATFTTLPLPPQPPSSPEDKNTPTRDMIYHEEGEMPQKLGVGLRWTKKYMWRLSENGRISVWFVKVGSENEADYLFHDFDFDFEFDSKPGSGSGGDSNPKGGEEETFVAPPVPPPVGTTTSTVATKVITARGNHLCINDMYRTAYAFRVHEESGEVVSWASRHVVKGPKKDQDIVNLYQIEG